MKRETYDVEHGTGAEHVIGHFDRTACGSRNRVSY